METIFNNFDEDGSGSLTLNEVQELFRQNEVDLDKKTL